MRLSDVCQPLVETENLRRRRWNARRIEIASAGRSGPTHVGRSSTTEPEAAWRPIPPDGRAPRAAGLIHRRHHAAIGESPDSALPCGAHSPSGPEKSSGGRRCRRRRSGQSIDSSQSAIPRRICSASDTPSRSLTALSLSERFRSRRSVYLLLRMLVPRPWGPLLSGRHHSSSPVRMR